MTINMGIYSNPYVYIKSHPKGEEKVPRLELHFSTTTEDSKEAKNRISKALIQISELIQGKGGKIKLLKEEG